MKALVIDLQDVRHCQATVASEHSADVAIYAANMGGQASELLAEASGL